MAANPQSLAEAGRSAQINVDHRFGKRSNAVRKQISLGVKRYMQRSPKKVAVLFAKLREERLGKRRTDLRGRTGPGTHRLTPTSSWKIVKLRSEGASLPVIAKECGLALAGAHYYSETLDLPPGPYDLGEPFTKGHARFFWQISGLTYGEFAKEIGISSRSVQADISPKRSHEYMHPHRARKYLVWRDRTVHALLTQAPGEKGNRVRWGKSSILKTFFPNLRQLRTLLVKTISAIGDWIRANPNCGENELGEWICDKAQFEKKRAPREHYWRKVERWLPQLIATPQRFRLLITHISENQTQANKRIWEVSNDLLAQYFDVSPSIIRLSVEGKTSSIAAKVLSRLIENIAAYTRRGIEREKRERGQRGLGKDTPGLKKLAAACIKCGLSKRKAAGLLYPTYDQDDAYNKAKQLFRNHPDIIMSAAMLTISEARTLIASIQGP